MKNTLFILPLLFGTAAFSTQANAAAHCFADVKISNGTQSVNENNNRDRRTNGKKWRQVLGNHRSECNSHGTNHFNSLDLVAIAKANKMCGTITAEGSSWIGTSRKRGILGPKKVLVECEVVGPSVGTSVGTSEKKSDYQYATKLVCGPLEKGNLVIPGDYRGAINIHNPSYEDVDFRYKFATAAAGKDGEISFFKDSKIGPDGAQYFGCDEVSNILDVPQPFDGFFVIESREPLDVVAYYTTGKGTELTVDVETTRERTTPNDKAWSCGNTRADLANVEGWRLGSGLATVAETITHQGTTTPIHDSNIYQQDGMDLWLSNQTDVNSSQAGGDYNYELDFCLCDGNGYPTGNANVSIAALRADNSVVANIDGASQSFVSGSNSHNASVGGSGSTNVTSGGDHFLRLASKNAGSFHAVGLSGTIVIQNGYLGSCEG